MCRCRFQQTWKYFHLRHQNNPSTISLFRLPDEEFPQSRNLISHKNVDCWKNDFVKSLDDNILRDNLLHGYKLRNCINSPLDCSRSPEQRQVMVLNCYVMVYLCFI